MIIPIADLHIVYTHMHKAYNQCLLTIYQHTYTLINLVQTCHNSGVGMFLGLRGPGPIATSITIHINILHLGACVRQCNSSKVSLCRSDYVLLCEA